MDKGKLIIEVEKDGDELRFSVTEIRNLTPGELANLVGALLNNVISKGTNNKVEQAFWKACALRDICSQIGLESTADRLNEQLRRLEREEDGRK